MHHARIQSSDFKLDFQQSSTISQLISLLINLQRMKRKNPIVWFHLIQTNKYTDKESLLVCLNSSAVHHLPFTALQQKCFLTQSKYIYIHTYTQTHKNTTMSQI